ncbi:hypothetical protein K470DRAFT_290727 [Piedraia hortae CBS 480.64]|uniref:Uncharacterized protein n=1 Tax=Piedraia hortae CBS 480.64 TaxID=1314780 RepID=A0A6A7BR74_9PEZI|nr:hypothetical protein K470DRAFT_290727 [Piedraia hortae CBS 480.64]
MSSSSIITVCRYTMAPKGKKGQNKQNNTPDKGKAKADDQSGIDDNVENISPTAGAAEATASSSKGRERVQQSVEDTPDPDDKPQQKGDPPPFESGPKKVGQPSSSTSSPEQKRRTASGEIIKSASTVAGQRRPSKPKPKSKSTSKDEPPKPESKTITLTIPIRQRDAPNVLGESSSSLLTSRQRTLNLRLRTRPYFRIEIPLDEMDLETLRAGLIDEAPLPEPFSVSPPTSPMITRTGNETPYKQYLKTTEDIKESKERVHTAYRFLKNAAEGVKDMFSTSKTAALFDERGGKRLAQAYRDLISSLKLSREAIGRRRGLLRESYLSSPEKRDYMGGVGRVEVLEQVDERLGRDIRIWENQLDVLGLLRRAIEDKSCGIDREKRNGIVDKMGSFIERLMPTTEAEVGAFFADEYDEVMPGHEALMARLGGGSAAANEGVTGESGGRGRRAAFASEAITIPLSGDAVGERQSGDAAEGEGPRPVKKRRSGRE